jgi:hypothetical protein
MEAPYIVHRWRLHRRACAAGTETMKKIERWDKSCNSLYQISDRFADKMDQKEADLVFLEFLKAWRFPAAKLYYLIVRLLGRFYWGTGTE